MSELESKILRSFTKKLGKEVEGLDLIVCVEPDTWPDDDGQYSAVVEEKKDNGKVWDCYCTKNGNIKEYFEL